MMNKTPQEVNKELYEEFGDIARFADLCVSWVDQEPEKYPACLDWHGQPEVVGVNSDTKTDSIGNLAGVLIDAETIALIDLVNERILETDDAVSLAFVFGLVQTRDPKRDTQIMALYNRLVSESLKQQYRAAG